jgi:hypothetical protein
MGGRADPVPLSPCTRIIARLQRPTTVSKNDDTGSSNKMARVGMMAGLARMILAAMLCVAIAGQVATAQTGRADPQPEKIRLFVTTDIGSDPDDKMSMVRLMTYANQFDIEGLVATRNADGVFPELIGHVVGAYAKVRDNLEQHERGFPLPPPCNP